MKKKVFFLNALIMTLSTLIIRSLGISFRVYMSNKIGTECIGLYQLIVMIYFFVATVSASGINLVVTRLVSETLSFNNIWHIKIIMRICICISLLLSVFCAFILYFSAGALGNILLKDSRAILSLKILAPSLPFLALSSCYRGYFMAVRKASYAASEQLIEQIIEFLIFAILINLFPMSNIEYTCAYLVLSTTIAEVISFLFSYFLYAKDLSKRNESSQQKKLKPLNFFRKFISIWLPTTGNACLRSGFSMFENIMIPKGLKKSGASYESSLSAYGMLNGMVMPVITFPSAFLMSFSTLLLPEFSEANVRGNKRSIKNISNKVFAISFYFSIWISGIFVAFGKDLGIILYSNQNIGVFIAILAPILPLMYLDSIVDAMLKGLNEQLSYFTYNVIDSAIRLILMFILLPICGIKGVIIIIFLSEILNSSFSIAKLMNIASLKLDVSKWIIKPIFAIFLPCLCLQLINESLCYIFTDTLQRFFFKIIICSALYFLLLPLMGCISNGFMSKFILYLPCANKVQKKTSN